MEDHFPVYIHGFGDRSVGFSWRMGGKGSAEHALGTTFLPLRPSASTRSTRAVNQSGLRTPVRPCSINPFRLVERIDRSRCACWCLLGQPLLGLGPNLGVLRKRPKPGLRNADIVSGGESKRVKSQVHPLEPSGICFNELACGGSKFFHSRTSLFPVGLALRGVFSDWLCIGLL